MTGERPKAGPVYLMSCFFVLLFSYCLLFPYKGTRVIDKSLLISSVPSLLLFLISEVILIYLSLVALVRQSVPVRFLFLLLFVYFTFVARAFSGDFDTGSKICLAHSASLISFLLAAICSQKFPRLVPLVMLVMAVVYSIVVTCASFFSSALDAFAFSGEPRLSVVFGNPNHLGNLLAFACLMIFCWVTTDKSVHLQTFLWIILLLLTRGLILTMSRGAMAGFIAGLVIVLICLLPKVHWKRLAGSVLLLALIAIISFRCSSGGNASAKRFQQSAPAVDHSVGNRLEVWKAAGFMIRDNWQIGVGLGRFGKALDSQYLPAGLKKESYLSAMNNYITLAAEAGVFVAMLYVACLVITLLKSYTGLSAADSNYGTSVGMLGGAVSLLIFACTTYTLGRIYANVLLWSSLGYLAQKYAYGKLPVLKHKRTSTRT